MSGIINLLPDSLANQIAAGEVIQRPASAVKELMENALDAGATKIRLILKDSGKTMIQVVDNGKGMSETDARLCFERHATSKINQVDDLFRISSFGFRGEALASIAAIAHVELITKRSEDELGTHVIVEGSRVKKQEPVQHAGGTSFTIKNLFYNTPARRKFLKSDPVELKHVLEEFTRIALPNPDVFFSVHHNENELYHFPVSNLRQRLVNYFGKSLNEKIVPVEETTDFVKIAGFIGRPDLIKKKRGDQYLFVNQRYIKSNYINHAIKNAYENLIPDDHHPFYVLMLDIDPSTIDINIHPTKQEIKFENERLIYNYVRVMVKQALAKYCVAPSLDFNTIDAGQLTDGLASDQPPITIGSAGLQPSYGGQVHTASKPQKDSWNDFYRDIKEAVNISQPSSEAVTLTPDWANEERQQSQEAIQSNNFFQIHESYIVSPIKSGLMIIDQQAAHQRILFEDFSERLANKKVVTQQSLFPETFKVNPKNSGILESLLTDLAYVGFGIEKFSTGTYVINSVPTSGLKGSATKFIEHFLETYADNTQDDTSIQTNIAKSMAVNASIKKGQRLEREEMQELIDKLFACKMPYTNPNGHKTFITMSADDLQSKFKI